MSIAIELVAKIKSPVQRAGKVEFVESERVIGLFSPAVAQQWIDHYTAVFGTTVTLMDRALDIAVVKPAASGWWPGALSMIVWEAIDSIPQFDVEELALVSATWIEAGGVKERNSACFYCGTGFSSQRMVAGQITLPGITVNGKNLTTPLCVVCDRIGFRINVVNDVFRVGNGAVRLLQVISEEETVVSEGD